MKPTLKSIAIAFLSLTSLMANASDITSNTADKYIRVSKKDDLRKFELCSKSGGIGSCLQLGYRGWYKTSELEHQRTIEQWQAAGSTAGALAATALALLTSGTVVAFAGATSTGALATTVEAGTIVAATGGTGVLTSVAKLGPVEQFKQQYLLRADVINDAEVTVNGKDDRDIQDIAVRLEEILHKLD
jgi:hypothetical protein